MVSGASEVERTRFAAFPDKVRDAGVGLEPIELVGVPAGRLVQSLNELPEETAVMLLGPMVDLHGQPVTSERPCQLLEATANRPVFTQGMQDLGCGVVGLSTARELQDRGFAVSIYARDLPPDTTSNVAGAMWQPSFAFDRGRRAPAFDAQ